jgi:hypothetical protein
VRLDAGPRAGRARYVRLSSAPYVLIQISRFVVSLPSYYFCCSSTPRRSIRVRCPAAIRALARGGCHGTRFTLKSISPSRSPPPHFTSFGTTTVQFEHRHATELIHHPHRAVLVCTIVFALRHPYGREEKKRVCTSRVVDGMGRDRMRGETRRTKRETDWIRRRML